MYIPERIITPFYKKTDNKCYEYDLEYGLIEMQVDLEPKA